MKHRGGGIARQQAPGSAWRRLPGLLAVMSLMAASFLVAGAGPANAAGAQGEPPGVDPGTPPWTGSANPIPAAPASFDPA